MIHDNLQEAKMFLKSFILSIVFLGTLAAPNAFAYKSNGVQRVNPFSAVKRADKEGFAVPAEERAIKKELLKLKRTNPKEFEKKLSQGLENPANYQSYLLEIKMGLQKTENAKKIAKLQLYKEIEEDWDIIKTTALNTRVDKTFATFKPKLKTDLNQLNYIKFEDGYVFQVGLWGSVTVSKNLKNILWKIDFSSKYDENVPEEGAENIKILEESAPSENMEPLGDFPTE